MLAKLWVPIALMLACWAAWVIFHPAELPSVKTMRVPDEKWQLPLRAAPDSAALVLSIEKNNLWGRGTQAAAAVKDIPLTAPNWRIGGVVAAQQDNIVLLAVEGMPVRQLRVGDDLPGGAKLLGIAADRICIRLNGKKRILSTYKE